MYAHMTEERVSSVASDRHWEVRSEREIRRRVGKTPIFSISGVQENILRTVAQAKSCHG